MGSTVIFRHVSEFAVRLTELAEAEGRTLRRLMPRLWMGLAFTLVGGGLVLIGAVAVVHGLYVGIEQALGTAWSSVITGLIMLALAGGFFVVAARLIK